MLTYTWNSGEGPLRVATVVTFSLEPTETGTLLQVEQSGFRADRPQNFHGAKYGWRNFIAKHDGLLTRTA
jgi:hypothetical protein